MARSFSISFNHGLFELRLYAGDLVAHTRLGLNKIYLMDAGQDWVDFAQTPPSDIALEHPDFPLT